MRVDNCYAVADKTKLSPYSESFIVHSLVGDEGVEPPTSSTSMRRSSQLS